MNLSKLHEGAGCASKENNPEWWFPERNMDNKLVEYTYAYTPTAIRARNICLNCPVFDECLEYSLEFKDLEGIWANYDYYERAQLRVTRRMKATQSVIPSADLFRMIKDEGE